MADDKEKLKNDLKSDAIKIMNESLDKKTSSSQIRKGTSSSKTETKISLTESDTADLKSGLIKEAANLIRHTDTDNSESGYSGEKVVSSTKNEAQNSFATHVYNEINSKIGGNNIEQFLCLLIPGIILNKEDYSYEGVKGPVVEANESRLANKMFDPCQMTNSDNGRTMPYQYKMALDMLTPKINKRLASQKNRLRGLLMSKFPYDFGDGIETHYTLQEVYSRLYDEYMDEIYEWKKYLAKIKENLRNEYPDTEEYENAFLQWYEDNAGDYLDKINEKKSKVLSVFSPNDMKILEGVLDSGSGAELQEARQNIYNHRKITPNGGYVYPVSFEPPNWFDMIGTSFTSAELMESPEKIIEKIQRLSLRRTSLYSSICDLSILIDNSFKASNNSIKRDQKIIYEKFSRIADTKSTASASLKSIKAVDKLSEDVKVRLASRVALPAIEIKLNTKAAISDRSVEKLVKAASIKESSDIAISKKVISDLITSSDSLDSNLKKSISSIAKAQETFLKKSKKLTDNLIRFVKEKESKDKSMEQYVKILEPLKTELKELDAEIEKLNKLLNLSTAINDNLSDDIISNDILLPKTPKGFTKIEFEIDAKSLDNETEYITDSSTVTSGSSFLFNGLGSRSKSVSENLNEMIKKTECSKLHVSMNISKVGIVREWFNPGVFFLTGNMYRLCNERIAPEQGNTDDINSRIKNMQNTVFPCYPVSLVLARDMQIRFSYDTDVSTDTREVFEKHANSNGGFLLFSGKDEYGRSDLAGVHTYFSDQTVTLKFDTTQVIGYYLQATATDKSTFIDDVKTEESKNSKEAKTFSMAEFSDNYRQVINNRLN